MLYCGMVVKLKEINSGITDKPDGIVPGMLGEIAQEDRDQHTLRETEAGHISL